MAAGRPKGSENRLTGKIRAQFEKLLNDNLDNMKKWIEETAAEDPAKAFDMMLRAGEYVLPKLARVENTGLDGEPQQHQHTHKLEFVASDTKVPQKD